MSFKLPDWLKYEMRRKAERLGRWWKDLAVRRWANNNPALMVAIAGASVLLLLVVIVWLTWSEPVPEVVEYKKEWFYDLNTGELFTAQKGLTPPIEAPSGPLQSNTTEPPPFLNGDHAGVRAYLLTYVDEPNEAERFIAFLETSNPQAPNDVPDRPGPKLTPAMQWGRGRLLRRLRDERWVSGDSPYGQAIFKDAFAPGENGKRPSYYQPE